MTSCILESINILLTTPATVANRIGTSFPAIAYEIDELQSCEVLTFDFEVYQVLWRLGI
jgi:hypothetical protein